MTRAPRASATTPRPIPRRGFTLIEIMFGLALTAMVGVAVAAMLHAVSFDTSNRAGLRTVNVKQRVIAMRLNAAIRSSKMVLAHETASLVLWTEDSSRDDRPNLSELRRIEWDDATGELWSYRAPSDLPPAQDIVYGLFENFERITERLEDTRRFPGERWGTGVAAWSSTLDDRVVQNASLLSHRLTVEGDSASSTGVYAASLRSR